ncbi:MAG: DUF1800 domain-containing protein [Saprospiraceae bacterium]|nr:DUF1800 domain-containing protein [Saprospiraceae bacterium]
MLVACTPLFAQTFIGAGEDDGIVVETSDDYRDSSWTALANGLNTINGSGLLYERFRTAYFLEQASIGFESRHLDSVMNLGIEGWIDAQMALPQTKVLTETESVWARIMDSLAANGVDIQRRPNANAFQYAWWQVNMTNEDLLRHKVASALAEIWVVSRNSDLTAYGYALASYYDVLAKNAFGNYRDLMYDVTLHPAMGYYLSHANNPKSDTVIGRFPDENYARELMQLFTIGLFELNNDGSHKQLNGMDIPTYDNDDVIEYSEIFTGLSYDSILPSLSTTLRFGINKGNTAMTVPMIMYEDQHEPGAKTLLGGEIVPDGQTGLQDINQALDNLFNHPNVGPFVCYRLIQRMVKSNPSPAYIDRVASIFNNNGQGVRGDMAAVVKAILLDEEARLCEPLNPNHSHLKQPLFRFSQFARMVDKTSESGNYWNNTLTFSTNAGQAVLAAPSVFNFYLPIDAPNGAIEDASLVAPEFRLHDSRLSVGFINQVYDWTRNRRLFFVASRDRGSITYWDQTSLEPIAQDVEHFINWIDANLTHGKMKDSTRQIIRDAINQLAPSRSTYLFDRISIGMYLALISPDYNINR